MKGKSVNNEKVMGKGFSRGVDWTISFEKGRVAPNLALKGTPFLSKRRDPSARNERFSLNSTRKHTSLESSSSASFSCVSALVGFVVVASFPFPFASSVAFAFPLSLSFALAFSEGLSKTA